MTSNTIVDLELEIAALKDDIDRFKVYGSKMTLALAVMSAAVCNAMIVLETGSKNARELLPPASDSPFKPDDQ